MACYTAYLASGHTLLCKSIKANTIQRYLAAAANLSVPAKMVNPCLDIMGNQCRQISDILRELKRWEKMPNRKEPVTKSMVEYVIKKGKSLSKTNPNNIYLALSDWLILSLQAGFRRKEWAQDRVYLKKHKDVERNIDGSSAAFILKDFEFRAKKNKRIDNSSPKGLNQAATVNIKWRFQKNNDNGQVITYVKDDFNRHLCAVEACKRIHNRAINLKIQKDPLTVYTEINKKKS